ncbi:MAG: D-alanyl-D-alanine carboxypeptidase/D-alanyl-D-alanine-endopeptidase [Betaproteobacteria bacterium HGW-Betaproteobacteria-22]|nr:MAG: D-alanyl-D-alanine carboxypeptidase/D-alanyl-D-alanine-endopeptidase [Betaproteobacteria bacterium HGW-Betaproteobacteria-22]
MKRLLLFVGLMLATLQAGAELPPDVSGALKKAGIPTQNVAIYIRPVNAEAPLLEHNATQSMNPASVMKLVTTNAALELLGPTYRWKTEVYSNGTLENELLNGDLIIKGYGDPAFKAQDLWRMLQRLRQLGIKNIHGDLIIDKDYFDKEVDAQAVFDGEIWRAYNAMPSTFLVNARNTSFRFSIVDGQVKIDQEFELPEIKIINNMKVAGRGCAAWRSTMTYQVNVLDDSATVTFNGTFSPSCGERYIELSLFNDTQYAYFSFKKLWQELGGSFEGQIKVAETPDSAVKLIEQFSDPLGYVVRDVNKWSNNLMARQLLLTIAAEQVGAPARVDKGEQAIQSWLRTKNLRFNELVVDNGSGLSRNTRISAEHLGQMLVSAYNGPTMPEFMASLAILSKDGTVMGRLKEGPSNGRAHLKTGSLNGVSAIAGYVLDANGHRHVLVMLVNHAKASSSKSAQDALIDWVSLQP